MKARFCTVCDLLQVWAYCSVLLCLTTVAQGEGVNRNQVIRKGDAIMVRPNGVSPEGYRRGWRFYIVGDQDLMRQDSTLCDAVIDGSHIEIKEPLVGVTYAEAAKILRAALTRKKIIGAETGVVIEVYKSAGGATDD